MEFPVDLNVNMTQSRIAGISNKTIKINSGITTLLGPNGSGKTQILKALKLSLNQSLLRGKKVRYISAGRLGPLENFRSNTNGRSAPNSENTQFGDKSTMAYRHLNESVLGDYQTLSERPDVLIKIQERLRKLFKRNIFIEWDGGQLKINFERVGVIGKYSSGNEASGLLHLVAMLAAIYDDEVSAILIDEPEVSLHPQLQSFLFQEITKYAGDPDIEGKKLVFISTHSTEFLQLSTVDELSSIVFCKEITEEPVQIDPSIGEFQSRKIQALLTRMGQEHKLALFCNSPLLVEGPSDQILTSALSRILSLNTEAAGSQILPVTGKGQFPAVIKLMRLIGKSPVMLGDADALTDSLDIISSFTSLPEADLLVSSMGSRDASTFSRLIFTDFVQLVQTKWDSISQMAQSHSYWINRDPDRDENIAKKRSVFCTLMATSDELLQTLDNSTEWVSIKNRLITLLDLLESLGCFVLRLGTVEAYYKYSDQLTNDEKPNSASHEATEFLDDSKEEIELQYSDIIRAIKFASDAQEINESEAIRDIVLAIVAPTLAKINNTSTPEELNSSSISLFANKSNLFSLSTKMEDTELYLIVELGSKILDVEGFPLKINKNSNPILEVNRQMKLT